MLLQDFPNGGLGLSTRKAVNGLTILDDHHRGQASNTQLRRQHLLFIGVDLGQQESPSVFVC